jgi:hypothetical protein
LLPGAEFQAIGNAKLGNFFTNSTRWGGTYRSSALRFTKHSFWISFSVGFAKIVADKSIRISAIYDLFCIVFAYGIYKINVFSL